MTDNVGLETILAGLESEELVGRVSAIPNIVDALKEQEHNPFIQNIYRKYVPLIESYPYMPMAELQPASQVILENLDHQQLRVRLVGSIVAGKVISKTPYWLESYTPIFDKLLDIALSEKQKPNTRFYATVALCEILQAHPDKVRLYASQNRTLLSNLLNGISYKEELEQTLAKRFTNFLASYHPPKR